MFSGAYGKARNRNETETGNGNWKWKLETEMKTEMQTKDAPITGAIIVCLVSILLSNRYGTGFMSHALPLLLYCAL